MQKDIPGYENYYYECDSLYNKIQEHKSSRNKLHRYEKHAAIEYFPIVTDEVVTRIKNVFDPWFTTHPAP